MSPRIETADELLDQVVAVAGEGMAENAPENVHDFLKQFLPIPRHFRVFDPSARVIIGDKGAGKSQLFQALKYDEGRKLLTDLATENRYNVLPLERSAWCVGFETGGANHPPSGMFDALAGRGPADLRTLWLALLLKVLNEEFKRARLEIPAPYRTALERVASGWDLAALIDATREAEGVIFATLDRLEEWLANADRYVVVVYDELDRVSPGDWSIVQSVLQGLVQFWAAYSRRWQRLRCKIFLRRDLFDRAAIRGPDVAKIAWNPVELVWSPGELYQLLFKRLANVSAEMKSYLERGRLTFVERGLLGFTPTAQRDTEFAHVVKHMFGEHMGKDASKGLTLRWIPRHLQDGHGRGLPRPLLRLMQEAAKIEKRDRQAERPHLVHHTALRGGLEKVSEFRVEELVSEEFPWMRHVEKAFEARRFKVPAERRTVLKALDIKWPELKERPPETDPDGLLDYLVELGIASVRTTGKIDVGDLYMKGLHLKRHGGAARPKAQ